MTLTEENIEATGLFAREFLLDLTPRKRIRSIFKKEYVAS